MVNSSTPKRCRSRTIQPLLYQSRYCSTTQGAQVWNAEVLRACRSTNHLSFFKSSGTTLAVHGNAQRFKLCVGTTVRFRIRKDPRTVSLTAKRVYYGVQPDHPN
ncbi:hypothetical protein RvY_04178 [Ramazzottius varieornatus]|uniref:Uncharacterized protein n=1 Tax=Ramazzottius varieornatus TaxID=947166 RepID=A0A1D1UQM6_RAMVA|nr:hypothetical protein RvY_04178 [Ramazzottius varieornatus]